MFLICELLQLLIEQISEFITRYKTVLEDVLKNMKSTEDEIAALQKKAEQVREVSFISVVI
jgi:hypothetical protein